jgi:hypothetical protein
MAGIRREQQVNEAEGRGFEPPTPFGAPDFETPEDLKLAQEKGCADKKVDRTTDNNCQNGASASEGQLARISELLSTFDASDLNLVESFIERMRR